MLRGRGEKRGEKEQIRIDRNYAILLKVRFSPSSSSILTPDTSLLFQKIKANLVAK